MGGSELRMGLVLSTPLFLTPLFFCFNILILFHQDKTHPVIPFAVMSGFACVSGCLCGILPETLGQRTLETLEDASDECPQHKLSGVDRDEEHLTSSV